ncbi:hypothetical protein SAMN05216228_104829 [Rhizobium tibeticum]|uniref:Uncharacterized protein n=1 Tax=Rhizobium tibeticum TaxID=501024 RepID=A0A1H8VWM0_9HYPH|nr:hypothetical protein RTCCBAU85039_3436 [Rhizobium tibeticum]SEP19786.1 hypothetical protein SAMN05216228_104829 [Rhizobium tibeticum]
MATVADVFGLHIVCPHPRRRKPWLRIGSGRKCHFNIFKIRPVDERLHGPTVVIGRKVAQAGPPSLNRVTCLSYRYTMPCWRPLKRALPRASALAPTRGYSMSLPRLDHNGMFSSDDLAGLRGEFDAWCERDAGDCTLRVAMRSCGNGLRVRTLPLSPQHLRLSFRPAEATLARRAEREALRPWFESISANTCTRQALRSAEMTTSKPAMPDAIAAAQIA